MFSTGFTSVVVLFLFLLSITLYSVFHSVPSNIDEVLSINPSTVVFVFGNFNVHHKDRLIYSDGTDRPGELCYDFFSISNDLTHMIDFLTWILDCDSRNPSLLDFFISLLTLVFVLQWFSLHWEILIMFLSQFPFIFFQTQKVNAPFYRAAFHYSLADLGGLRDHLRDVHGTVSLNSVLLLLPLPLLNFVNGFRLVTCFVCTSEVNRLTLATRF